MDVGDRQVLYVPWDGRSGSDLRLGIERGLGRAGGDTSQIGWAMDPVGHLLDAAYLRRRRALLLVMLALPGRPIFSPEYELRLHTSIDDVVGAAALLSILQASRGRHASSAVQLTWPTWASHRWPGPGHVVFELNGAVAPDLVVANFGTEDAWLGDGAVMVQSHPGSGAANLLSDNDLLPPMTSCWFATK